MVAFTRNCLFLQFIFTVKTRSGLFLYVSVIQNLSLLNPESPTSKTGVVSTSLCTPGKVLRNVEAAHSTAHWISCLPGQSTSSVISAARPEQVYLKKRVRMDEKHKPCVFCWTFLHLSPSPPKKKDATRISYIIDFVSGVPARWGLGLFPSNHTYLLAPHPKRPTSINPGESSFLFTKVFKKMIWSKRFCQRLSREYP